MEIGLEGKVVLITGSSRGIGAKVAEGFAKHGANIVINFLKSKEKARDLADYLIDTYHVDCLTIQADVTDQKAVKKMVGQIIAEFETIDIVVNNALHRYLFDPETRKLAWNMSWEDYQQQLDGCLKSTYLVCKEAIPYMKKSSRGRIINMISNLVFHPVVPYHDYTTAKGALLTYSKNLAADLGAFGITVNCVAPGLVYPTDASARTKEEIKDSIISQTPMGRVAIPEDIVGSVLYFASDWAKFVTGESITVDGGYTMK